MAAACSFDAGEDFLRVGEMIIRHRDGNAADVHSLRFEKGSADLHDSAEVSFSRLFALGLRRGYIELGQEQAF
jgi:hypothetical protein